MKKSKKTSKNQRKINIEKVKLREYPTPLYGYSELHWGGNWDMTDSDWDEPIEKKSFLQNIIDKLGLFYYDLLFNLWKIKYKIKYKVTKKP